MLLIDALTIALAFKTPVTGHDSLGRARSAASVAEAQPGYVERRLLSMLHLPHPKLVGKVEDTLG